MPQAQRRRNSPAGVTLRTAAPADLPELAAIWRTAWLDGHRGRVPAELMAARGHDHFAASAKRLRASTTVATDSTGRLLGLVIIGSDDGEVIQLAVDHAARNRGVGAALLRSAEAQLSRTHRQAWLAVVPDNASARSLYARNGWHDTGPMTYPAPTSAGVIAVPVRRYAKTLAEYS